MPSKEIYKGNSQIIRLFNKNTRLYANDSRRKIFHIAANTFSDDAVADIAQVHIFVRAIALAVKSKNTSLVHAAAVGLNGKGALICGRGGQGKSTLSISALLDGFQYVSDDYLILKKTRELCAYPIYSIATLTPEMQVRMDGLNAEFLAKNPGNSKNIFDISAHSASFVDRLPIAVAVFPELQGNDPPGIEKIDIGQPLTQVVISSMRQVGEWNNPEWTKLLISLLRELTAYKIRLSNDLRENVSFLREILGNRT
jgi:hypothetical protein